MKVKEGFSDGHLMIGIFILVGSPIITEVCATLPLDWIIMDTEAGYMSKFDILTAFQSLKGSSVLPMIRLQELNKHMIEFALDIGAKGVLVPKVSNKHEAEAVVNSFYYPPLGSRGVNPVRVSNYFESLGEYLESANDHSLAMIQLETKEAIDNIAEIASVDGIDVLFIGCGDLAASYNQIGNVEGALMDEARKKVLEHCHRQKKIPGIFAYNMKLANQYIQEGFKFVAIGNDIKLLKEGIKGSLSQIEVQEINKKEKY